MNQLKTQTQIWLKRAGSRRKNIGLVRYDLEAVSIELTHNSWCGDRAVSTLEDWSRYAMGKKSGQVAKWRAW
ncbi:hypothetical protein N7478_007759 [Penicillium angulare]|uniref:uncharacterized protein n=1 Tax=Penicillium angulare TaxID=116970 RepID=UPI0025423EB5|nr:uncharacterized protein N7478_007759 [Penicillium angulare]KAJ5272634.1 hypothetical protein N7478_007759 [Penicillium angulare]